MGTATTNLEHIEMSAHTQGRSPISAHRTHLEPELADRRFCIRNALERDVLIAERWRWRFQTFHRAIARFGQNFFARKQVFAALTDSVAGERPDVREESHFGYLWLSGRCGFVLLDGARIARNTRSRTLFRTMVLMAYRQARICNANSVIARFLMPISNSSWEVLARSDVKQQSPIYE